MTAQAPDWSPCRVHGHATPPRPDGRCRDCDTVIRRLAFGPSPAAALKMEAARVDQDD